MKSPKNRFISLPAAYLSYSHVNKYYGYIFSIVISIIVIVLRLAFVKHIGQEAPFLFFFSAILLSAWYGGLIPGLLTTILIVFFSQYFFLYPYHSLVLYDVKKSIELIIYLIEACFTSIIFENLRNTDNELKNRINQQAAIAMLGQQALDIENFSVFLNTAAKIIAKTVNVEYCRILQYIHIENKFLFRAGYGWRKGLIGKLQIDASEHSQIRHTLLSEEPIIIENIRKEKQFQESILHAHNIISGISVIIPGRNYPEGVLAVYSTNRKNFSRDDIYFLQSVANILAAAIENNAIEQRKDEFISMASHELKTPVTSIKILTQMMQKNFQNQDDEKNFYNMSRIDKQLNNLTILINDLLDISKMQSGKLRFHKEKFDMNELVREVVENMQSTTHNHTIHIKGIIKNTIFADKERISQVLINLLSNAIKYSPEAHKVNVVLENIKNKILIRVQDFGIGIAKKNTKKVFYRFYRVSGKQEQTFPGLGIGLYITSQIIKYHSGSIWVDSEEGKGSTFSFTLPITKNRV